MSPEEIEKQINRIAWGSKYVSVKNQYGEDIIVILKSLSLQDKSFIEFIYERAKSEARNEGVYSKFELIAEMQRRGVWTKDDDDEINRIREDLKDLYQKEKEVKGTQLRRTKKTIEFVENSLKNLIERKNTLFNNCIENHAEEQRVFSVAYCCACDEYGNKIWKSWGEFTESIDLIFIRNILYKINTDTILSSKELRRIARDSTWRFRWNAAKSVGDLFGKPILEFDLEQQGLLYWTQVYDSVYESYEKPPQEVIEDDEALDNWFEEQDNKDKAKQLEKGSSVGKINVSEKVMRHGEVFIMTNPAMTPDTKYRKKSPTLPANSDVSSLNNELTKEFKKKELERIKEKGMIGEKGLRGRKNKIARKLIGSKAAILNRNKMSGHAKGRDKTIMPGENIS